MFSNRIFPSATVAEVARASAYNANFPPTTLAPTPVIAAVLIVAAISSTVSTVASVTTVPLSLNTSPAVKEPNPVLFTTGQLVCQQELVKPFAEKLDSLFDPTTTHLLSLFLYHSWLVFSLVTTIA